MSKSKSKVETLTLKPSEVVMAIRAARNTKVSLFIWGPPGISKSASTQQVATSDGEAFIDLRLSQMDPTDLRGIPFPTNDIADDDGIRWAPPVVLPKDLDIDKIVAIEATETIVRFRNLVGSNGFHYVSNPAVTVSALDPELTAELLCSPTDGNGRLDRFTVVLKDASGKPAAGKVHYTITGQAKGILALEEFNSAPQSVQAAAYQLVLDRRLGEYEVPDGIQIVAMGNRETDKGIVYKMPTPIMNRFIHIEMVSDFEDWQRWALTARVHRDVVGYLSHFKNKLMEFDAGSAARGFATPRSWHFVSDILTANDDLSEMVGLGLLSGAVGDAAGIEFMEFRRIAADLPQAEVILSGQLKQMPKQVDVSLAYALTTTLSYELLDRANNVKRLANTDKDKSLADKKQWWIEADNVLQFMMVNFSPEICIMGAKTMISVHKLPFDTQKMKHFDTFAGKFKDLIMS